MARLVQLACVTGPDMMQDVLPHSLPPVVARDCFEGLVESHMTAVRRVVPFQHQLMAQIVSIRHDNLTFPVPQGTFQL